MRHQAQTLIETLAAIFILTTGVTAGVGLANYALGSSTSVKQQFIATGLAREGIEAVKNMRDTNWLQAGAISGNCYDYVSPGANDGQCYKNWLTQNTYGIQTYSYASTINPPSNPTNYILSYFTTDINPQLWILYKQNNQAANQALCGQASPSLSYALDFQGNPIAIANPGAFGQGYYKPSCNAVGSSGFYRQIILSVITAAPFNQSDGNNDLAELYVQSRVWWTDNKFCPPSATYPGPGKCSVELDTYLTNWKNY